MSVSLNLLHQYKPPMDLGQPEEECVICYEPLQEKTALSNCYGHWKSKIYGHWKSDNKLWHLLHDRCLTQWLATLDGERENYRCFVCTDLINNPEIVAASSSLPTRINNYISHLWNGKQNEEYYSLVALSFLSLINGPILTLRETVFKASDPQSLFVFIYCIGTTAFFITGYALRVIKGYQDTTRLGTWKSRTAILEEAQSLGTVFTCAAIIFASLAICVYQTYHEMQLLKCDLKYLGYNPPFMVPLYNKNLNWSNNG